LGICEAFWYALFTHHDVSEVMMSTGRNTNSKYVGLKMNIYLILWYTCQLRRTKSAAYC